MHAQGLCAAALMAAAVLAFDTTEARPQHAPAHHGPDPHAPAPHAPAHDMWLTELGGGWRLLGMAQMFPIVTIGAPGEAGSPLRETEWYLTQPAVMANLETAGQGLVLRTTVNLEGVTLPDGELTYGGWGEGFIDRRHPHTLLHELMLSANFRGVAGGAFSVSAGRGFAPYGTDDPMARPGLKYPTNHHLSQILERWTVNAVFLRGGWSVEAGLFGGNEPEGPYDFGNIGGFGRSWSARLARRWGGGSGPMAEWEASASYAIVTEEHHGEAERTTLSNAALRHSGAVGVAGVYGLVEASRSEPGHGDGYFSILAETRLDVAGHQPYLRVEHATRPEYAREGAPGSPGFFRYDHGDAAIGATRWLIGTVAYAYEATGYPFSIRPFAEAQFHRVRGERGGIDPDALFGARSFWSVSLGARLFLGGEPMRMGSYGVLDPMTAMHRMMSTDRDSEHDHADGADTHH